MGYHTCKVCGEKFQLVKEKKYIVCDLSIISFSGKSEYEAFPQHDSGFTYHVGETVVPDRFDEDRWNECSNGIHFFITKQEAIDY